MSYDVRSIGNFYEVAMTFNQTNAEKIINQILKDCLWLVCSKYDLWHDNVIDVDVSISPKTNIQCTSILIRIAYIR